VHDAPEFAGHVRQVDVPTTAEYKLTPQLMHVAATLAPTVVEYFPASQLVQVTVPAAVEYFPASQSIHTAVPKIVLYFPATQAVHGPPFGPVNPGLQAQAVIVELGLGELELEGHARQVVATVAPTVVEYVVTPQLVHALLLVVVLYVPATQTVHAIPFGPVYPILQMHKSMFEPGPGEFELAGHAKQAVATVAAVVSVYVPVGHAMHTVELAVVEKVPNGHSRHNFDTLDM
jgi:hypothetical protein